MGKVCIVTSGSYSDYSIDAVFSKKELAEEYCSRGDDFEIEEWKLDEPIPDARIQVEMSKEGEVGFATWKTIDDYIGFHSFFPHDWMGKQAGNMTWVVKTDDMQRAIKVVNEKRAQILALGIWGDGEKVRALVK